MKAQASLIEKLRHQLAGHRAHRPGASSETVKQLQLALETHEIAAAAMTARMKLPLTAPMPNPFQRHPFQVAGGGTTRVRCGL